MGQVFRYRIDADAKGDANSVNCSAKPVSGMFHPCHVEHHSRILNVTVIPTHLDLQRGEGLHIEWTNGDKTFYPIDFLRKMSPSADAKTTREELETNPLAILPHSSGESLSITDATLVGNYAVRLTFSDGHRTGIYSWDYLRGLKPPEHPQTND